MMKTLIEENSLKLEPEEEPKQNKPIGSEEPTQKKKQMQIKKKKQMMKE